MPDLVHAGTAQVRRSLTPEGSAGGIGPGLMSEIIRSGGTPPHPRPNL